LEGQISFHLGDSQNVNLVFGKLYSLILHFQVQTADKEEGTEVVKEVCAAICNVLKNNIAALCAETIRPAEIKNALSLCFTELESRGDISVLKPCFQL